MNNFKCAPGFLPYEIMLKDESDDANIGATFPEQMGLFPAIELLEGFPFCAHFAHETVGCVPGTHHLLVSPSKSAERRGPSRQTQPFIARVKSFGPDCQILGQYFLIPRKFS